MKSCYSTTCAEEYMSLCYWPDPSIKSGLLCKPFMAQNIVSSYLSHCLEESQYILVCPRYGMTLLMCRPTQQRPAYQGCTSVANATGDFYSSAQRTEII
jgi:hypothetical protein